MSYHSSLWQSHPGLGRGSARGPADDHRSISGYSADSRDAGSPLSVSEAGVVTPAQAYASAVKTGEAHDRALYYTIERRQPERKGKADPQFVPSHLGDSGSPERGLSFAQRLYASALSNRSSTLPSSNIPVIPPIKHTSSSALPISGGNQASCGVPHRKTSLSTSSFDTSSEVSQSFNPSDLYHSSVATHGFPLRASTSPDVSTTRPPSLLPVLQIQNSLPVTRLSYPVNLRASCSSSQNFTLQHEIQNSRLVLHQSRSMSMEAQSYSIPAVSIHGASGLQRVSVETHQDFHPPAVAGGATPLPLPLEQQLLIPPSSSPPPFEEHEQLSNLSEGVVVDVAPVVIQSPAVIPHEDGLRDSSLQPPPEVHHEEVPLYSLVDEQLPPPAFEDLQATSATEASVERSPVVHPETLLQEVIEAPSSPSPPPPQSPPPFPHGSPSYASGKAPACALLDKTSYCVGTSKNTFQDIKVPPSSVTTWRPFDPSPSDPPSVVPIDFQWPNRPPSMSPPTLPSSAVPHGGTVIPSMTFLLPSDSRPLSVLSSHPPVSQSTKTSYDSHAIRKSTTSSPPLVGYHTKPTAKQSGRPCLPPLVLQSDSRPPEGSNTVRQGRRDSRPLANMAEDNATIDALTRSMSNMMEGPSPDTRSLAYENLSSGRQCILEASLGNQQNIPIILASHPSGTPKTIGSLNEETYRPEAERLIQEPYRRPTHAETSGKVGYGIQGFSSANPPVIANILSSQHSPRAIPSLGTISPAYSHDELQTESVRTAADALILSQFGETVASRSSYSDRPHIASGLPSRSFPNPLQPSHHSIDRDVHGPVASSGSVPPQQQKIHSLENLDPMKRGGHVVPPPPPPPIASQPWNVSQTSQTSSYSQDSAMDRFSPSTKAPALNSNDLARKFAHDALLAPPGALAYAFYGTNQR